MANESALLEDQEVEAPSLRETIEKAFDEQEGDDVVSTSEPSKPAPVESEAAVSAPSAEPTAPATPETGQAQQAQAPTGAEAAQVATELKAPAQWKPAVREKWNSLPREVQEEVLRRESDNMRLIGSVGPKIRAADMLAAHLEPYRERLQESGVSPLAFVEDVFSSVKTLSEGSPQERAEVVANMVQAYGVDVRALDAILSQRLNMPPEVLQARQVLARSQYQRQEQQQTVEHQSALEAEKALAAFGADPKNEFLETVRDLMADLIDANRATTLADAYSAAVWAHPETRKILLERAAQARVSSKNQRAQAARRASSSVSGSPSVTGAAAANPNMSVREAVEAAFDEHSQL